MLWTKCGYLIMNHICIRIVNIFVLNPHHLNGITHKKIKQNVLYIQTEFQSFKFNNVYFINRL